MIRRPLADHCHGVRQAKEERRPSDDEASRDALLPRRNSSKRNTVVLDTFGGSGSTLIACEWTGRACHCVELDPKYCDVIRHIWAEFVHGEGCDWQSLTPVADCTSSDMPDMSLVPNADGSTQADS